MKARFHENVRFCPKCGVESLERDYYKQAEPRENGGGEKDRRQIGSGTEWWCRTCGFSFRIDKSVRWCQSDELQRRDRQQRVGKASQFANPAIRDAFARWEEKTGNKGVTSGESSREER